MRSFISVAILGAVASADCRADHNKEDPCMADAKCTWCFSGAVPSACYDLADAAGLPAGVFNCEAKSVAVTGPVKCSADLAAAGLNLATAKSAIDLALEDCVVGRQRACTKDLNKASVALANTNS